MDIRINYKCNGAGIPFIFQHGLAANVDQPHELLGGISAVNLISMDAPGHGASPLPADTRPSFQFYADQLMILMEILKLKKAIFGGVSMGAGIALNMALRHPDKVSALVLVRPAWLDRGNPDNLALLRQAAAYIRSKKGKEQFSRLPAMQALERSLPQAARSVLGVFDSAQREEIPQVLECMIGDKPMEELRDLGKINAPCLIVGNENDPLHPLEIAKEIHRLIGESQMHQVISRYLDDSGHRSAVKQIVTKFIAKHEKLLEG